MKQWYLIYCKARQEIRARENLNRQGFEVFHPQIPTRNKLSNSAFKFSEKFEALFPRYLFLRADPEQQSLAPVSSTLGVANFVRFGKRYAVASDNLVTEIKNQVGRLAQMARQSVSFKQGEQVLLNGHGFEQAKAIYTSASGESRAMILLNILGNESSVEVPMSCLSKVS